MPKALNKWSVYILLCDDETLYTGITTNLQKRLSAHKSGKGARYTKSRGAKELLYSEKFPNRSAASKREAEIKKLSRSAKLALIQ